MSWLNTTGRVLSAILVAVMALIALAVTVVASIDAYGHVVAP